MDPVEKAWRELNTNSRPKCPKLFYRFTANETGYELQLTDLIVLWAAKSTTEELCEYAHITRAGIDPSSSTSQRRVLLSKLAQSLADGTNVLKQDENPDTEAIILSTTIDLPRPLSPLKWEFYLVPQGAEGLAENVLKPCLHEASNGRKKIESLVDELGVKDRVITKLVETIEASSVDLSLIFPGIAGVRARRGQVKLIEAQRHVTGLGPFSQSDWERRFESESIYGDFEVNGIYNLVAGNEKCPKHSPEQHVRWLKKLPKSSATTSQIAQAQLMRSSSPIRKDTDSENEFETQPKRKTIKKQVANGDSSSDTETDSDDPRATNRRKPSPLKPPPQRLKTREQDSTARSSSPMLPPLPPLDKDNTTHDSDATESSSEHDFDTVPKSKGRLGRLGAKRKSPMKPLISRQSTKSSTQLPSSPPPIRPRMSSPPSSPLRILPQLEPNTRPKSSSSAGGESETAPSKPTTPRKLGRLRTRTESTTLGTDTDADAKPPSTQTTPTHRRLGRLGRIGASQSQNPSPSQYIQEPNADKVDLDGANDSDASTASSHSPSKQEQNSHLPSKQGKRDDSEVAPSESVEPETRRSIPREELSKEEKADMRRQELKRKIGGSAAGGSSVGNGGAVSGLRKKRKL